MHNYVIFKNFKNRVINYCMIKVLLHITDIPSKARRALVSRYLFDNWFSLLIRYALTRLGFNVRLTAKVDDCAFELSPETFGVL